MRWLLPAFFVAAGIFCHWHDFEAWGVFCGFLGLVSLERIR